MTQFHVWFVVRAGDGGRVRVLHPSLDRHLLPQDAPEPPAASHHQPHLDAVPGQLQRTGQNETIQNQRPDLQNISRQSYDHLTIIPKLRSTYDGRLIYKSSYEGRKAFLRYD